MPPPAPSAFSERWIWGSRRGGKSWTSVASKTDRSVWPTDVFSRRRCPTTFAREECRNRVPSGAPEFIHPSQPARQWGPTCENLGRQPQFVRLGRRVAPHVVHGRDLHRSRARTARKKIAAH